MENSNKIKVIKSLIVLGIVLSILIGASFAYFTVIGNTNAGDISGKIGSTFNIDFGSESNLTISTNQLLPILASEVTEYAELATFSVVAGDNSNRVNYTLSLADLNITPNLQVSDFRWQLVSITDPTINQTGTFQGVNGNSMLIMENIQIDANTTHLYEFRVWIQSDGITPQNDLLNGSFSAKFMLVSNMVYES